MRNSFFIAVGFSAFFACMAQRAFAATPQDPCEHAKDWRVGVCVFAKSQLKHFAWGYEHGLRDYALAKQLAVASNITYDDDVLFAASMLHDMGGFAPYEKAGVDHAVRTTEVIDPILRSAGFPMEKFPAVKTAVRTHSYYDATKPTSPEGVLLHDADCLDFVGAIAVMRIISIAGNEPSIPTVKKSLQLLESLHGQATKTLYSGEYARGLASARTAEMRRFLDNLAFEAFPFGVP